MSNLLFSYTLESIDIDKRVGVLLYKRAYPINSPTIRINVELSAYLCGALKKRPEKYVGVKFTSTNQDKDYDANPFKLKHYVPGDTSDIPEHFRLETVSEMESKKVVKQHIDGSSYVEYTDQSLKPKYFKRYMKCVNIGLLKDLPNAIRIVQPKLETI